MTWTKYEASGDDYIPMTRWSKDHWSVFLYLEHCAVDRGGVIDNQKMRCAPRLHRPFAHASVLGELHDGSKYPTILRDGEIPNHDDWSCLEDMVSAGLVESEFRVKYPNQMFGHCIARVKFTPLGYQIASMLRQHKAEGGTYSNFEPMRTAHA